MNMMMMLLMMLMMMVVVMVIVMVMVMMMVCFHPEASGYFLAMYCVSSGKRVGWGHVLNAGG